MNKKKDEKEQEVKGSEEAKEAQEPEGKVGKPELVECEERVQSLENQSRLYRDQLKRALADYQNLGKRAQEERGEWIKTASKGLILKILPVLDTLELAQKHLKDQGLELSIKQFIQILQDEGVEKIEAEGKEFDPHTMEAVQISDGEEGKVLEELRKGYIIGDKVLRPSQVKVGQEK